MTESDLNYWKSALNGVVPKHLVTPEVVALRDQQNKMLNLMAKKNADYGNAFNKGCDKLGYKYGLARMYDKLNRLIHFIEDDFKRQGWGLGLAIADEIVAGHGGVIGADSADRGAGSTFWVVLPLTH